MAGNRNSGPGLTFRLTEKELEKAIVQYKADLASGEFVRPSWPHFCAYLGYTEEDVAAVMRMDTDAYRGRATQLKRMGTWMRGQILSGAGWSKQPAGTTVFALKQDVGDGVMYTDYAQPQAMEVKVTFGGGDKRSNKAAK